MAVAPRSSTYAMLPVEEALALVLERAKPSTPKLVSLSDAEGCILAEDQFAAEPLPPFRASMKDGYAVIASDGVGKFHVAADVTAGHLPDLELTPGNVAYITTGAAVPNGADAIVMIERTEDGGADADGRKMVQINKQVASGADIRPIGSDIEEGQKVLSKGEVLHSAEIGILATIGITQVPVFPRAVVGVLSSGDELVNPSEKPGPGKIRDSNRAMLCAAAKEAGADVVDLGICKDDEAALTATVQEALQRVEILITTGGVSMGDLDLLKPLLEKSGTVHFGRVNMKPGKPTTFATAKVGSDERLVFALPGNPVSALVTFNLFARPAIRKMSGFENPHLTRIRLRVENDLKLDPERPEYHRATVSWSDTHGCFVGVSTGRQISSRLLSMRTANALLELPQREGKVNAGDQVSALLIGTI